MTITIFKDIKSTNQPFHREVGVILNRIREGASKDLVKKLEPRKTKHKEIYLSKVFRQYALVESLIKEATTPLKNIQV